MSLAMIRGATHQERSAILAGLRLLQHTLVTTNVLPEGIRDIYEGDGQAPPLEVRQPFTAPDQFDELCEALNRS